MREISYTTCLIIAIVFFGSCNRAGMYEEKEKTVDSLSGAVNSIVKELRNSDTLVLQRSIARYTWYRQFIEQNVNDTITLEEADNLQHFYTSGKTLENFSQNRKVILARAILINAQLLELAKDIKNKTQSQEQLLAYSQYEKNQAAILIEAGYQQQKQFHAGLEEFKNSLRGVESLIRSRNKGELPTIIKDTVSL